MMKSSQGEPTLAEVQAEFPHWVCTREINRLYYGHHDTTGQQVIGEDPLDLRDQIKAAEARHAHGGHRDQLSSTDGPGIR
jgi:hypothetical protein